LNILRQPLPSGGRPIGKAIFRQEFPTATGQSSSPFFALVMRLESLKIDS